MKIEYDIEGVKLNGGEMDTFYKLFWFGPQDDGDLPSKSGMAGLIEKGLAVKCYELKMLGFTGKPNSLSIKGDELAREYYRKKYNKYKFDAEHQQSG